MSSEELEDETTGNSTKVGSKVSGCVKAKSSFTVVSRTCTIMCADGHKFPDGSAIANMICRDGTWIPSQPEWKNIPDCLRM